MLKPNAKKVAQSTELAEMIAKFQSAGGTIVKAEPAVAIGLRKRKYLKKVVSVA
jgi:hypothetical protein